MLIYIASILVFQKVFEHFPGYQSTFGILTAAIIITCAFDPLKNYLQNFIDKILFRGTPIEIVQENEFLRSEVIHAEKFKAVATLASGVAHEIKNPLTAIKTFFERSEERRVGKECRSRWS